MPKLAKLRSPEYLDREAAAKLTNRLLWRLTPKDVCVYLCLHIGLTSAEAAALRFADIDFERRTITVNKALSRIRKNGEIVAETVDIPERVLPLPQCVYRTLCEARGMYTEPDQYLMLGPSKEASDPRKITYHLRSLNEAECVAPNLSPSHLQATFIHHALEMGIDYVTLGKYMGIPPRELFDQYSGAMAGGLEDMKKLGPYGSCLPQFVEGSDIKRMNLLILGAGSQGSVVQEIAAAIGIFDKIDFLDDMPGHRLAIDSCVNYARYLDCYPLAIPSFGDCVLRREWFEKLRNAGFLIPKLIHPTATLSQQAFLDDGVVVEAKVIVGNGVRVGKNCIVSAGAVLDKGCQVGAHTHIGCSCTVTKDSVVPELSRVAAGTVYVC